MSDKRLRQANLLLDFYFAPWGASKSEVWEYLSRDSEFKASTAEAMVREILSGNRELSPEEVRLLNIVVR